MSYIHVFLFAISLGSTIAFMGSLYQDYQEMKCLGLTQDVLFLEQTKNSNDNDVLFVRQKVKDKVSYCANR